MPTTTRILACILSAMLPVLAASADMRTAVETLRTEPMSLFDWGVFQLEEELQSVRRNDKDFIRVSYDSAQHRLVVEGVFLIEKAEVDAINAKRACFVRHHAIKLTMGVIDTDRIHLAPAADYRLGMKFSHHNSDAYPDLPDAAALGARMLESVYIKVGIATDIEEYPFVQVMRCEGRLLSQDVVYHGATRQDLLPE